jgi:DNA transformation protein and related proteins
MKSPAMKAARRNDFVDHVCELLAPLGAVRPRVMFGGHGIYVDEVFCAIVAHDTLYLKVDDGNRADFEALGYGPFKPFEDKDTVMSYYEVPAEVMDDHRAIVDWARKAMEAARRSGTRKRATGAPRTKKARSPTPSRSHKR